VRRAPARLLRGVPGHPRRHRAGEAAQEVEPGVEAAADQRGEPDLGRPLRATRGFRWIPACAGMTWVETTGAEPGGPDHGNAARTMAKRPGPWQRGPVPVAPEPEGRCVTSPRGARSDGGTHQNGTSSSTSSGARSETWRRMPEGSKPKRSSGEKTRRKSCSEAKKGANFPAKRSRRSR